MNVLALQILEIFTDYLFSKQTESIIGLGNANVSLEFHFNTALPTLATALSTLYVVSFFDRMWQLQADGITQKIIK